MRRRTDDVLRHNGGRGAEQELSDRLLRTKGLWRQLSRDGWSNRTD